MDMHDAEILHQLTQDGRMSVNDLSGAVHLSQTPVARRLKKLEDEGVIKGYTALIDEKKLGFTFSVFVSVRLERQIDEELVRFEARIEALPEVVDCWLMTGNHDYLLRVVTRDIEEFEKFLVGQLTKLGGISSIESSIPLRCVKSAHARYR
ncbi:MAG: Lrp/AsnC family transcriptional regulator [Alphaproteobacteria bacterium]|nr:Lrp/AsnC family transcriptional regulator [Alphaproteobacteria bacterium]